MPHAGFPESVHDHGPSVRRATPRRGSALLVVLSLIMVAAAIGAGVTCFMAYGALESARRERSELRVAIAEADGMREQMLKESVEVEAARVAASEELDTATRKYEDAVARRRGPVPAEAALLEAANRMVLLTTSALERAERDASHEADAATALRSMLDEVGGILTYRAGRNERTQPELERLVAAMFARHGPEGAAAPHLERVLSNPHLVLSPVERFQLRIDLARAALWNDDITTAEEAINEARRERDADTPIELCADLAAVQVTMVTNGPRSIARRSMFEDWLNLERAITPPRPASLHAAVRATALYRGTHDALEDAEALLHEHLDVVRAAGRTSEAFETEALLAWFLFSRGRLGESEERFAALQAAFGDGTVPADVMDSPFVADALAAVGKWALVEPLLTHQWAACASPLVSDGQRRRTVTRLLRMYESTGRAEEAREWTQWLIRDAEEQQRRETERAKARGGRRS